MKNQFVPYSIALALKELGFDEPCIAFYKGETLLSEFILDNSRTVFYTQIADTIINSNEISAPLWQQVIDWCRKKHQTIIAIHAYHDLDAVDKVNQILWDFTLWDEEWNDVSDYTYYHSYEEAREQAVLEAIKLLKGENK